MGFQNSLASKGKDYKDVYIFLHLLKDTSIFCPLPDNLTGRYIAHKKVKKDLQNLNTGSGIKKKTKKNPHEIYYSAFHLYPHFIIAMIYKGHKSCQNVNATLSKQFFVFVSGCVCHAEEPPQFIMICVNFQRSSVSPADSDRHNNSTGSHS